nr:stage II sporulation protein E [Oceanispirochaeta sp.]
DGVTQSGLGMKMTPLGWGDEGARQFLLKTLDKNPELSSTDLSRALVRESVKHDVYSPRDDITCGSLYFRKPRQLMIATGAPYDMNRDRPLAGMINGFEGRTIIAGGTTANIIARELGRSINVNLGSQTDTIPPCSTMEGVNLVTEGIITMSRVCEYLNKKHEPGIGPGDPAEEIVKEMINSDVIQFMVGTRINESHQDPNMPVALEIRRNLIKSIADCLKNNYFKEVLIKTI